MTDTRPIGMVLVIAGAVGIAVSALADPLGIGEGDVFGWLQITGVVVGGVVALLGVAFATDRVPLPGRSSRQVEQVGAGGQNTTIVTEESTPREDRPTS